MSQIAKHKEEGRVMLNKTCGGELACIRSRFTREGVFAAGAKCTSRHDFYTKYHPEHSAAKKYGWLDEIIRINAWPIHANYHWTYESCLAPARKFGGGRAWAVGDPKSYCAASKHDWMDKIHAEIGYRRKSRWDHRRVLSSYHPALVVPAIEA